MNSGIEQNGYCHSRDSGNPGAAGPQRLPGTPAFARFRGGDEWEEGFSAVKPIKRMSLREFLRWDDGTDTRYELIGGFPVAIVPAAAMHRILATRLIPRIDFALENRRPCNAQDDTGVVRFRTPESAS